MERLPKIELHLDCSLSYSASGAWVSGKLMDASGGAWFDHAPEKSLFLSFHTRGNGFGMMTL
jgi:hypothetical protein